MVELNELVLRQIQDELRVRPDLSLGLLYQLAVHLDSSLETMKPRQFNVTYVMPAKQRLTAEARRPVRRSRGRKPSAAKRASRKGAARAVSTRASRSRHMVAEPRAAAEPTSSVSASAAPAVLRETEALPAAAQPEQRPDPVEIRPAVEPQRARIRVALLTFARDLADAEERAQLVRVLTEVDRYIERIG
jgi:hypothetical protein